MNAHTPGPYEVNGEGAVVAQLGTKRTGHILITAQLTSALEPIAEETVEANAHLFKAAPQLLDALRKTRTQAMRAIVASGSHPDFALLAVADADAAIAAAEGRS